VPVLAVVDQVDAGLALARDHVGDRGAQPAQVLVLIAKVPFGALQGLRKCVIPR
jgi:hypothetical protein